MPRSVVFRATLTLLMVSIFSLGLVRHEKKGLAGIGLESVVTLDLFAVCVALLLGMGAG